MNWNARYCNIKIHAKIIHLLFFVQILGSIAGGHDCPHAGLSFFSFFKKFSFPKLWMIQILNLYSWKRSTRILFDLFHLRKTFWHLTRGPARTHRSYLTEAILSLLPTTSALYISFFLLRVCVWGFLNLNVAQPASCVSSRTFFNRSGFIFCCFVLYYSTLKPSVLFSLVSCVGVHGMKECLNTHTHGTVNSGMNQIIDTKCRLSYTT